MQTVKIEQTDSQCAVTWRYFSYYVFFMLPCLMLWTALCVFMTYKVFIVQGQGTILIALILWIFWFRPFRDTSNMLFGKTRLVLDENGFYVMYTCLIFKHEKRFTLAEICRFETHFQYWLGYLQTVCNNGKKFKITASSETPKNELDDLCSQLNAFLESQKSVVAGTTE